MAVGWLAVWMKGELCIFDGIVVDGVSLGTRALCLTHKAFVAAAPVRLHWASMAMVPVARVAVYTSTHSSGRSTFGPRAPTHSAHAYAHHAANITPTRSPLYACLILPCGDPTTLGPPLPPPHMWEVKGGASVLRPRGT